MANKISYSLEDILSAKFKNLPQKPGIYIYKNQSGQVLYVGKAINLFNRIKQYFEPSLNLSLKTRNLVKLIRKIEVVTTLSEFDALLLEAKLIKLYQPKYNLISKDDKSPIYIKISFSEELPKVEYIRKNQLKNNGNNRDKIFGPFPSNRILQKLMRDLRQIIPYCSQKRRNGKPCFYTQIGLCQPCPSYISGLVSDQEKKSLTKKYRTNLFQLSSVLSGKSQKIIQLYEKNMKDLSFKQQYEDAIIFRNKIERLNLLLVKHYDPMLYMKSESYMDDFIKKQLLRLKQILSPYFPKLLNLDTIECVGISNISGVLSAGSVVSLTRGLPDYSKYRKFNIKTVDFPNDFAMINEVTARRFRHPEWNFPDLFIIDGGKGQLNAAKMALNSLKLDIPVIGLAKKQEDIIIDFQGSFKTIKLAYNDSALEVLKRVRDEAHRFALSQHKFLRQKYFKNSIIDN